MTPLTRMRLTPALLARLDAEAARLGLSRTAAVEAAVGAWLEREPRPGSSAGPGRRAVRLALDDATGPALVRGARAPELNRQMAEPPRKPRR